MSCIEIEKDLFESLTTDHVTDLMVHNYARILIKQMFAKASSEDIPITVIRMDIDNLKTVNDTLGHQVGNKVIWAAAEAARISCRTGWNWDPHREMDYILSRIGGDEQVYILYNCTANKAEEIVKRIRQNFKSLLTIKNLHHTIIDDYKMYFIDLTFGIAQRLPDESFERTDKRADDIAVKVKAEKKTFVKE